MSVTESLKNGAYHISNNTVEYNPVRRSNFSLVVPGLKNILRVGAADGSTDAADIIADGQAELILALKSCDIPSVEISKTEINRGNSKIKFAGKPTFSDISIEAYDYIGADVKDTLLAWQNLSYNTRYDYVASARKYKFDCTLYEYTPDYEEIRHWDIKGAWVNQVTQDGFSADDDGVMTVKATLVVDWFEMHMPD